MKVCFFGSYDKTYGRNTSIISAMQKAGLDIAECHESPKQNFFFRAFSLFFRALKLNFDVMWVGFPGHLETFPAKLVCILKKKPMIFDVFISKYDSDVEYGLITNKNSLHSRFLRFIDRNSCLLADKVLLDTPQHVSFFVNEFRLPEKKFAWFYVGTNEKLFYPRKKTANNKFRVLFYGRTTPFHGFRDIVKAAEMLVQNPDISFTFIGSNMYFRYLKDNYQHLKNCTFKDEIPLENLPLEIANADVCLGAFGTTPKIDRVIMNKIFEALSMKRPMITAKSDALENVFEDKKNIIFVKRGSSEEIKNAILLLKNDPQLKEKIAENGHALFNEKFSSEKISFEIKKILSSL